MEVKRGTLIGGIGGLVSVLLFFLGPWVYGGIGPLNFGFATGFDIATSGRVQAGALLYVIPVAGIIAVLLAYADWKETINTRWASAGILVAGVVSAGVLLYALPQLSVGIGGLINLTQAGWGIWVEIALAALMLIGGILNLVTE